MDLLALDPELASRVAFRETLATRVARVGAPAQPLDPFVTERLRARGIAKLWSHQAEAIDALRAGRHVVVATGTATGKSLCYQVPIVEAAIGSSPATALLVFPTKALAQDQLRQLRSWLVPGLDAQAYDGDTDPSSRARIRREADVVLTNPEMLHLGILPSHERWSTFLLRLRYVVVDELHILRGVFGGHVAQVLRRLRRLCAHYGSDPTFCFSSATIGNPAELASTLLGTSVEAITRDGGPRPERRLLGWQRPLLDESIGARRSANAETAELLAHLVGRGHPTLAFVRSRRGAELVAALARHELQDHFGDSAPAVAAYRGGYLPAERRALEEQLVDGTLRGVVATSALELGIDVAGLDAVVCNGFPGTLASMWQQIGRAGRAGRRAAAILVLGDDQLDQWYARHPAELVGRTPEAAVVNPDNPFVLRAHVACAAHELPLEPTDDAWFGSGLDDAVRSLVLDDLLKPRAGRMFWAGQEPPAHAIGLRSGASREIELLDDQDVLVGTVDGARVFQVAHPGAVYLHQGRQYLVTDLDLEAGHAHLEDADDLDEHTRTREQVDLTVLGVERSATVGEGRGHLGTVEVTHRTVAYQRRRTSTNEVLETVPLDVEPRTLSTWACWLTIAPDALEAHGIAPGRTLGAVHAAEHGLIGLLPLFAICDRWDVGGISMAMHAQTGAPSIFVYDAFPGGAGIAPLTFERLDALVAATRDLVEACRCDDGCPSCVQSPKCGNWNEYLDKAAAIRLLRAFAAP